MIRIADTATKKKQIYYWFTYYRSEILPYWVFLKSKCHFFFFQEVKVEVCQFQTRERERERERERVRFLLNKILNSLSKILHIVHHKF